MTVLNKILKQGLKYKVININKKEKKQNYCIKDKNTSILDEDIFDDFYNFDVVGNDDDFNDFTKFIKDLLLGSNLEDDFKAANILMTFNK